MALPEARLNRAGDWAVCHACRMQLARLVIDSRQSHSEAAPPRREGGQVILTRGALRVQGRERARAVFDPHWAPRPDGVWHWTPRAQRVERMQDRMRELGQEPPNWTLARRSRPRQLDGRPTQAQHGTFEPREVACPRGTCGSRQVVDPADLREQGGAHEVVSGGGGSVWP